MCYGYVDAPSSPWTQSGLWIVFSGVFSRNKNDDKINPMNIARFFVTFALKVAINYSGYAGCTFPHHTDPLGHMSSNFADMEGSDMYAEMGVARCGSKL